MKKKCPQCKLVNYPTAPECMRCGSALRRISAEQEPQALRSRVLRRCAVLAMVSVAAIASFYVSLIFSAKELSFEQRNTVRNAIEVIDRSGFSREAFMLRRVAVFRSTDNWLNASVAKENAFAATNFPFQIVTVYSDYFTYPLDDVEQAAILLHEAKHLQGADEKDAYEFVWRNREKLGWTGEKYAASTVWNEIRNQTRDYVPGLFVCDVNNFGDCTEPYRP